MTEQVAIDGKLDEMLQILAGNDSTDAGSENSVNPLKLVSKEGTVNETARTRLVVLIYEIKDKKKQSGNHNETSLETPLQDAKRIKYNTTGIMGDKHVHIYMPMQTTRNHFQSAIKHFLSKSKYRSTKTHVWHDMSNLKPDAPLIVVCPITSRIQPDVDMAIKGLNWPHHFAVLVLHICRESSLPRIPTSSKMDGDDKYRNIAFIDIAFTPEEGIYGCELNLNAHEQLLDFIQSLY